MTLTLSQFPVSGFLLLQIELLTRETQSANSLATHMTQVGVD